VQTGSGSLSLNGTALGSGDGVRLSGAGNTSLLSGSGSISLTGLSAGDTGISMNPTAGLTQVRSSGAGNLTFTADTMDLVPAGGKVQIQGNGGVFTIAPLSAGATIGIGDATVGALNWNAAEVAQVLPGFLKIRIGNMNSGAIDVRPPGSLFSAPIELLGPRASIYPDGLQDQLTAARGSGGAKPAQEPTDAPAQGKPVLEIAKELQ
jgi:hypothetical protein